MQHPLSFFQSLLQKETIENLRTTFYSLYHEEMILELDRDREFMRIMNPFDSESKSIIRYFHNYFKELCLYEQHNTLSIIEADVLRAGDKQKEKNYLVKIVIELRDLIKSYRCKEELKAYSFTIDALEIISEYINSKYKLDEVLSITKKSIEKEEKLKWVGNANVLVTLFYDLLNGQDRKSAHLSSSEETLHQFIYDSFVNKDGHNFEMKTIKKYWDEAHKRAKKGKRIEIPEVEE